MNSIHLNEHDANQGAQSSGEFLGMTGNSGWYLLGSGGATIMMVIFLWGILGVSLLLCLFIGIILCLGSVAYVFTLKNNKPEHYDTDFFESALVEAGVLQFCFGPRAQRLANPFTAGATGPESAPVVSRSAKSSARGSAAGHRGRSNAAHPQAEASETLGENEQAKAARAKPEPVVTRSDYDLLQEKLTTTEEMLEDALAEASEH
jgi:hypothetical protein